MLAAVLKSPGNLVLEDIPPFELGPGQVSVQVEACGICGSDLRYFAGENPWALHTLGKELSNPPNIVLGHEFAGTVVETGPETPENLLGTRVAVMCFKTCGECRLCTTGKPNLCKSTVHIGHGAGWGEREYYPGAMAERCVGWAEYCYELPEHVSSEEAALLDVAGVGLHAATLAEIEPGATVLVLGVGPVGSAIMQSARVLGASRVIAVDTYDVARSIADRLGAMATLDPAGVALMDAVKEITAGEGCNAVFDTVGTESSFRNALSLLAESGTLVNLAIHPAEFRFKGTELGGERRVRSSCNFLPEEYPEALKLVASGSIDLKPWITHRFPLDQVERAFDLALHKEESRAFKVIIEPRSDNRKQ